MSTFRNPVGPQSSKVYWRRRIVVGLGLLAVIAVVILLFVRPGASGAPNDKQPSSASEKDSRTEDKAETDKKPPAEQEEDGDCVPANIAVEAVTDKDSYGAGETPMIGLTITNTGSVACMMNVGSTVQELRITSGSEQIWSSKDCQTDPVDAPIVLEPNVPQSTALIPWDRTRSATTTCEGDRPPVTAGGASYHLTAIVGEVKSEKTRQFLLH